MYDVITTYAAVKYSSRPPLHSSQPPLPSRPSPFLHQSFPSPTTSTPTASSLPGPRWSRIASSLPTAAFGVHLANVSVGEDWPPNYEDWLPVADPKDRRRAGVLLHPTSLRGPYGIGDLVQEALRFIDWLHSCGLSLWQTHSSTQVLPLVPPTSKGIIGESPYSGEGYRLCELSGCCGAEKTFNSQGLLQDAAYFSAVDNKLDTPRWYYWTDPLKNCHTAAMEDIHRSRKEFGVITEDVVQLRKSISAPGMAVLHFAFGDGADSPHLPHNHERNQVVYTGTHDNDKTRGWWDSLKDDEKANARWYLPFDDDREDISWILIHRALVLCRENDSYTYARYSQPEFLCQDKSTVYCVC